VMRGAALIFHHAAMLVGKRQQGLYRCSFLWWRFCKPVRGQNFACCLDTWLKEYKTHTECFLNNKSGSIKLSEVQCIVGEDGQCGVRCSILYERTDITEWGAVYCRRGQTLQSEV
jgi:hypothetical protein